MVRVALLLLSGVLVALPFAAQAQDLPAGASSYAPASVPAPSLSWEARLGIGAANPGGRESGLANVGGEIATPRPFTLSDRFANAFVPRFHLGASANFNGTRYAYAGATWTVDITSKVFVEASLGAAIHDGKTGAIIPQNRLNLGCNGGTREAAALGVRLDDRWSLVATLEHFSTTGCADRSQARGPANIGARLGYSF
ncbi:MAG: acyloxyacyl hydrolase [Bosea sp. (in: a-proteobacteria)]|uniref:acyloxyacyl hydrolase n=1 Tax=Bosea sp. (in: a-proteobacteria) TaxID=1871050 RepID=UPI002732B5BF|nr:acyloxyacyl hydrolase [Bosea sp. (in: a-proteobacteria)]MDP3255009.1 acyloxyacyl hydrolase [Bosea sp. (in: a-proteobacteria)]MDP3320339.1 acyloxyacyl hydrolase [Bosea sp. (in: a-proteobacteria)]